MREMNVEEQIIRVADALEGIQEIMKHMDDMMLQELVERKKEASGRSSGKQTGGRWDK